MGMGAGKGRAKPAGTTATNAEQGRAVTSHRRLIVAHTAAAAVDANAVAKCLLMPKPNLEAQDRQPNPRAMP